MASTGITRISLTSAVLLTVMGCATTQQPQAVRRVTPVEWDGVVECLTLSARASKLDPVVAERVFTAQTKWSSFGIEESVWFRLAPIKEGFVVLSGFLATDARAGGSAPISGTSQETRRVRRQLDQQCLGKYAVADTAQSD
jgi:hypothetical protein